MYSIMKMGFTVNHDSNSWYDYEQTFDSLRAAYNYYNSLSGVPYKDLTVDDKNLGTITLLDSKGTDNLRKYFCLNDYA
jgi:hypothetical protein